MMDVTPRVTIICDNPRPIHQPDFARQETARPVIETNCSPHNVQPQFDSLIQQSVDLSKKFRESFHNQQYLISWHFPLCCKGKSTWNCLQRSSSMGSFKIESKHPNTIVGAFSKHCENKWWQLSIICNSRPPCCTSTSMVTTSCCLPPCPCSSPSPSSRRMLLARATGEN